MTVPDIINGLFESLGALALWQNCAALERDKSVRGVDWRATAFFSAWGLWNLFFYPHLEQWASFVGGMLIVGVNLYWLMLAYTYRSN